MAFYPLIFTRSFYWLEQFINEMSHRLFILLYHLLRISFTLLRMISGATYSGVPQNVHVFLPDPILFANPKSTYQVESKTIYFSAY